MKYVYLQMISHNVLDRLLVSCAKRVRAQTDLLPDLPQRYLYKRSVDSDKFVIILEGRATVKIGQVSSAFVLHTFFCFYSLFDKFFCTANFFLIHYLNQELKNTLLVVFVE